MSELLKSANYDIKPWIRAEKAAKLFIERQCHPPKKINASIEARSCCMFLLGKNSTRHRDWFERHCCTRKHITTLFGVTLKEFETALKDEYMKNRNKGVTADESADFL